jgi:hypothetical protein
LDFFLCVYYGVFKLHGLGMGGRRLGLGIWDGGVECGASFSSCFVFCQCQLLLEQLNPLLLLLLSVFLFSIAFLALEFRNNGTI